MWELVHKRHRITKFGPQCTYLRTGTSYYVVQLLFSLAVLPPVQIYVLVLEELQRFSISISGGGRGGREFQAEDCGGREEAAQENGVGAVDVTEPHLYSTVRAEQGSKSPRSIFPFR